MLIDSNDWKRVSPKINGIKRLFKGKKEELEKIKRNLTIWKKSGKKKQYMYWLAFTNHTPQYKVILGKGLLE